MHKAETAQVNNAIVQFLGSTSNRQAPSFDEKRLRKMLFAGEPSAYFLFENK